MSKPRLKLLRRANWQCADEHIGRCGKNPKQAYVRWLNASLRDAEARLRTPKQMGRPVGSRTVHRQPDIAVSAENANLHQIASPAPAPKYSESEVQKLRGTAARPTYTPGKALRINIERAVKAQKPMTTPHGKGNGSERSKVWTR